MERIIDVAQYIILRYKQVSNCDIDEMKLHKLLYFCQREALAITGEPMFADELLAWKYGPVSKEVRMYFNPLGLCRDDINEVSAGAEYIINNVVSQYGTYSSWWLSEMSHNELSWQNARRGLSANAFGNNVISIEDIRKDAEKVRPYDSVYDMYYDEFDDDEDVV